MNKEAKRKSIRFQKLGLVPLIEILGLSADRFIFRKNVVAKEVYLPTESACQDPVHNTWQLLTMRNLVLHKLNLVSGLEESAQILQQEYVVTDPSNIDDDHDETNEKKEKPLMLLIKRSKHSTSTRQRKDGFRQWSDRFTADIMVLLRDNFPNHKVKLYSDMDLDLMTNITKQITLFNQAEVVIGGTYVCIFLCLLLFINSTIGCCCSPWSWVRSYSVHEAKQSCC